MTKPWGVVSVVLCVAVWPVIVAAQPPPPPPPPPEVPRVQQVDGRVKVFIDCSGFWQCDSDYFRTNLTFVDHVRDREAADVHILITGQSTGAGGSEVTLAFIGRGAFDRVNDTLVAIVAPNAPSDAVRGTLVQRMKVGLTRYVAHSSEGETLRVSTASTGPSVPQAPKHDPWDFWVFRIRGNGSMSGERASTRMSFSGGVSANRVTDAWKVSLSGSASYRESSYDLGDGYIYTSISRDSSASGLVVRSLTPHWSLGARASVNSSTYSNRRVSLHAAPAIEYNVFPYTESTRRSWTVQYGLGVTSVDYFEVTLYDKASETLVVHTLGTDVEARQPWGQVSASVDLSQYLSQPSKYRVQSYGMIDLRIKKGLSLNFGAGASWIRDQINLPKGEASTEQILVRQRQLATSYDYSFYFGVSYTFGSIYNNIVNPRFGSSGGGGMVIYY
ncbi:MAG: hypothetical protein AB1806_03275 [Acidobacteriota bacterium]